MTVTELFSTVVGQERAVGHLVAAARAPVHAYLLVGPPGSGKEDAAIDFACALICPQGGGDGCTICRRVIHASHPDVVRVERIGARISVKQAEEIGRIAALSPSESSRRVLILTDFHLVQEAAPALLKTIEEPRAGTVFVILADYVPPELVTIASRCVRIDFDFVPDSVVMSTLVSEGIDGATARSAARAAAGQLERARLLAADPDVGARLAAWEAVPVRLDGTGAMAATVAAELLALIAGTGAAEALALRQGEQLRELEERAALTGERGLGRRETEDRHKREQRRLRTDELRSGLATLEAAYRDRAARALTSGDERHGVAQARAALDAALAVREAALALERNPNEALLIQALIVRLTPR